MADDNHPHLSHLRLSAAPEAIEYQGQGRGKTQRFSRDRDLHAQFLRSELEKVEKAFEETDVSRKEANLSSEFGLILNVVSEPGYPLAFTSLETDQKKGNNIVLLNLRTEGEGENKVTKAAIFVPYGKLTTLLNKVDAYADPEKDSKNKKGEITGPRNAKLLDNIATIAVAAFDALWTDPETPPTEDEHIWFEFWIRRDNEKDWEHQLRSEAERLNLETPEDTPRHTLIFPDHIVIVVGGSRRQIESSLDILNTLSEIRKARPCSVGLTDLSAVEQEEWIDEAVDRIEWPEQNAPAVCLLDSGVNRGHALVEPLLSSEDSNTVFSDEDTSDGHSHGTPMAGLAAFGDLRQLMLSTETWNQIHRLESIRLIHTTIPTERENYRAITKQGVYTPESIAPDRRRVYCMALTAPGPNTEGNPSSWSAALDQITSGAGEEPSHHRVLVVSAGNVRDHSNYFDCPKENEQSPIEDPAQAWNAISVGAFTQKTSITEEGDEAFRSVPLARQDGVSPFSRTSHNWRPDWPIGPDVVMEGGNLGRADDGSHPHFDSLQLLSTGADFRTRAIVPFNATSAATALAARVGARIWERYPEFFPETVRGLLVHSARWTDGMLNIAGLDPHASGNTNLVENLMRSYGFGVIDENRALSSLANQTTVIAENSIQPYKGKYDDVKLNQCHLYELPWPIQLFQDNPDHEATLRVTLSYFIEPNPGSRAWEKSQKYHYSNCLLRFRPIHSDQDPSDFRARLHAGESGNGESYIDSGWALGGNKRRKAGSLVQDVWKGTTGKLAEMGHIAVFPAKGWWAYRKFREDHELHGCHLSPVLYSLIISLETEAELPIYSEVETAISTIESTVETEIAN